MDEQTYQPEDFITITEVGRLSHMSRAGIYRAVSRKTFPAPVKFGPQKSLWIRREVTGWVAARIADRDRSAA